MEQRFRCTACGKCCVGWLPLTVAEAGRFAGRFPLAVVWTPVPQGHPSFESFARLGIEVRTGAGAMAVRIAPTVYIPLGENCPALAPDKLCGVHAEKPLRCRSMPFHPGEAEAGQDHLLRPWTGWQCDVSAAAPVVYRNGVILDRRDFDAEAAALLAQRPAVKAYAESVLRTMPAVLAGLADAAAKPRGGNVVLGLASLLRFLPGDAADIARSQAAILARFRDRYAGNPEYRRFYADSIASLGLD